MIHTLVLQAQNGDEAGLQSLSLQLRDHLRPFVEHLVTGKGKDDVEDVLQEILIDMVRYLSQLKDVAKFWTWIKKIAYGKVCQINDRQRRQPVNFSSLDPRQLDSLRVQWDQGMPRLIIAELLTAAQESYLNLPDRQRDALAMRCFQQMGYREIADVMDISRLTAEKLVFHARRSMRKALRCKGYNKGYLPIALGFFGVMTFPSLAASGQFVVKESLLNVGPVATLSGLLGTKAGITAVAAVVLVGATATVCVLPRDSAGGKTAAAPAAADISSSAGARPAQAAAVWTFYPEGCPGAVYQKCGQAGGGWLWLRNASGNYRVEGGRVVQVDTNWHHPDLRVHRLPGDSAALTAFLDAMEGPSDRSTGVEPIGPGAWVEESGNGSRHVRRERDMTMAGEVAFQTCVPVRTAVADQRDALHRRDAAAFEITGRVYGRALCGYGVLPLSLNAYAGCTPQARVGFSAEPGPVPSGETSTHRSAEGCPSGLRPDTFFVGLMRPWEGVHTVDVVRRDAAGYGLRSSARRLPGDLAEVTVVGGSHNLIYTIDLEHDLPRKVVWVRPDQPGLAVGEIHLTFQPVSDTMNPSRERPYPSGWGCGETLWLLELAQWCQRE